MIKDRDIVCLSFVTWDDHWATPQQQMSRLAKHNRIFFVDQPISPFSLVTGIRRRDAVVRQFRRWRRGYREVAKNVFAGSPPPILPLRNLKLANAINAFILRRWLARQVAQLKLHDPIYWNFQPTMPGIGRAVAPALSIYHCVDDFSGIPHWWNMPASVRAREAACCREADVVICTGRMLVDERRPLNANIHFVPEGADVELFATAGLAETKVPDDIAELKGKVVGYVGVVDFRLDTELLAYMAERQPDWSIAIVGPVKGDVQGLARLEGLRNVHFFGNRRIDQLPAYLKAMDACLIPYVLNDFTHHIFPLKLYEYMAAGKPIVATDMEEMRAYDGNGLTITRTKESFHEVVRDAMENDSPERAAERVLATALESWDHRVEEISEILDPMLRERALHAGALAPAPSRGTVDSR
jgi:glycosyltransferase involved in cell wall biosynthesis